MPFQFTLAAVLKYRKNLEQREYLALGRVHQEIAWVDGQLRECQQRLSEISALRAVETARGIVSVHLQEAYEREFRFEQQRDLLQSKRQELAVKLKHCLSAYQLARQKREILEELHSRQLQAYVVEQSRRAQRQIDDMFLARLKRRS